MPLKKGGELMTSAYVEKAKKLPEKKTLTARKDKVRYYPTEIKSGEQYTVSINPELHKYYSRIDKDFIDVQNMYRADNPEISSEEALKNYYTPQNINIKHISRIVRKYGSYWNKNYENILEKMKGTPKQVFLDGLKKYIEDRYELEFVEDSGVIYIRFVAKDAKHSVKTAAEAIEEGLAGGARPLGEKRRKQIESYMNVFGIDDFDTAKEMEARDRQHNKKQISDSQRSWIDSAKKYSADKGVTYKEAMKAMKIKREKKPMSEKQQSWLDKVKKYSEDKGVTHKEAMMALKTKKDKKPMSEKQKSWIDTVKKYSIDNGISYKEAMKALKKSD